jgi:SAM-dependent methyltransferase
MFERSAELYDLMYERRDYGAAAEELHRRIQTARPGARELLDVACGTGRHLEHLAAHYRVEGLDLNPRLLERARSRCADAELHLGDMTDFDLGRSYDVVTCLFSSIGYVRTRTRLRRTIANMARHLRAPGLLIVEPWFTPESFWRDHVVANFHDQPDVKLAWMYRHKRRGGVAVLDIHHLLARRQGVDHFVERHELGLFSREEMQGALQGHGRLAVSYEETDIFDRGLYVGVRKAPDAA